MSIRKTIHKLLVVGLSGNSSSTFEQGLHQQKKRRKQAWTVLASEVAQMQVRFLPLLQRQKEIKMQPIQVTQESLTVLECPYI